MESGARQVERILSENAKKQVLSFSAVTDLNEQAARAMEACDRTSEEGRADHEALLLFLCAIDDLQKSISSQSGDERSRLLQHAQRKLRSAEAMYERA